MRRIILLFFVALSPIFSLPVTKTTKKPAEVPTDLQVHFINFAPPKQIYNFIHTYSITLNTSDT